MTERRRGAVSREAATLAVGPSTLSWDGTTLNARLDEIAVPIPRRIRGVVRLHPRALFDRTFVLDAGGRHRWSPIAPCARVEVELEQPGLAWSGTGYLDTNDGDAPLEDGFVRWQWSRAPRAGGTTILYEATRRGGSAMALALHADAGGTIEDIAPPAPAALPPSRWRIARATRSDDAQAAHVRATLEDGPFYARSVLSTRLLGTTVTAVHESLCLDRFRARWVQALLPFRMPRTLR